MQTYLLKLEMRPQDTDTTPFPPLSQMKKNRTDRRTDLSPLEWGHKNIVSKQQIWIVVKRGLRDSHLWNFEFILTKVFSAYMFVYNTD